MLRWAFAFSSVSNKTCMNVRVEYLGGIGRDGYMGRCSGV